LSPITGFLLNLSLIEADVMNCQFSIYEDFHIKETNSPFVIRLEDPFPSDKPMIFTSSTQAGSLLLNFFTT